MLSIVLIGGAVLTASVLFRGNPTAGSLPAATGTGPCSTSDAIHFTYVLHQDVARTETLNGACTAKAPTCSESGSGGNATLNVETKVRAPERSDLEFKLQLHPSPHGTFLDLAFDLGIGVSRLVVGESLPFPEFGYWMSSIGSAVATSDSAGRRVFGHVSANLNGGASEYSSLQQLDGEWSCRY